MDSIIWVGYIAGAICTGSFLPQVVHTFRRRSCRDITWTMLGALTTGTSLWTVYGIVLRQWPIILANGITVLLLLILLGLKLRYHGFQPAQGD